MSLKQLSEKDKAAARKVGKLPKAPKKPKQSASVATLENYVARHNAYVDKIKEMARKNAKKDSLRKQIFRP